MRIKNLGGPGNGGFKPEDQKGWLTAKVAMTKGYCYPIDEVNLGSDFSYIQTATATAAPTLTNAFVLALEDAAVDELCHVMISGQAEMISVAILGTVGISCSLDSDGKAVVMATTVDTRCFAKNLEVTAAGGLFRFNFDGHGLLGASDGGA